MQRRLADMARGKWRGILMTVGLPETALTGKHGPCPLCGGTDRFRWDNKEGRGTFICNQCGAGDGIDLVMRFRGVGFAQAAREVESLVGIVRTVENISSNLSERQRSDRIAALLSACRPIEKGDEVDRYLEGRGVDEPCLYPPDLRTCENCRYADGVYLPAMVAIIRDPFGNIVSLHRTFVSGGKKADVSSPRRLMPGDLPDGVAIRLGPTNSVLGIAEGIETAFAACHRFEHPVWSALNSSNLRKWVPPAGIEEVVVYGDNDGSFSGQSAAYQLAERLRRMNLIVTVKIPSLVGTDWADEAIRAKKAASPVKSGREDTASDREVRLHHFHAGMK